ncbi:MAG: HAMP domain-containing protein [Armatimonadetes bacterium]|nr:HAMP domain-containing protein [Armatimonadota bacterium]
MRALDWYTGQVWLHRFLIELAAQVTALSQFNRAINAAQRMEAAFVERGAAMLSQAIDPAAGYGVAETDGARRTREAQVEIQSVSLRPEAQEPLTDVLEALFHFDPFANLAGFTFRSEGLDSYRSMLRTAFPSREAAVNATFESLNAMLEVERADIRSSIGVIGDAVLSFLESLVIIAVSTLGVGLIIAAIVTRSVTAPLTYLSMALQRVRGGDLSVSVDPDRSYRETAQMAQAFNAMAEDLRTSRQKIDESQRMMEARVADRTRQLEQAQAQLVHAEKLRALGDLVAGVAHELNNPLTSVLGYADLIALDDKLPEEVQRDVAIIVHEAELARRIVQNLLLFARQPAHEWDWGDLNAALEQTLNLRRYHLQTRGLEVVTALDPELPAVRRDLYQLQQVFLNLINNAFQALSGRSGRLEIRTSQRDRHAHGEFLGSGPGIAAENLHRIFDPFFTTKALGEGTGLGLSISYGIVQQHRGTITARKRPEGGAASLIELPLQGPEEEAPAALSGAGVAASAAASTSPSASDQQT